MKKILAIIAIFVMALTLLGLVADMSTAGGMVIDIFTQQGVTQYGKTPAVVGWENGNLPFSTSNLEVQFEQGPTQVLVQGVPDTNLDELEIWFLDAEGHWAKMMPDVYDKEKGRYSFQIPEVSPPGDNDTGWPGWISAMVVGRSEGSDGQVETFVHVVNLSATPNENWGEIIDQVWGISGLEKDDLTLGDVWVRVIGSFLTGEEGIMGALGASFGVPFWANGTPPDFRDSELVVTYEGEFCNLSITTSWFENVGGEKVPLEGKAPFKIFTSRTEYSFLDKFNNKNGVNQSPLNNQTTLHDMEGWALNYQAELGAVEGEEGGLNANQVFSELGIYPAEAEPMTWADVPQPWEGILKVLRH